MNIDEVRAMKHASRDVRDSNFEDISLDEIRRIHERYGDDGLFKFLLLVTSESCRTFRHFFELIESEQMLDKFLQNELGSTRESSNQHREPEWDCATTDHPIISRLNSHVLQPSLSRKLYNPGTHHGYLTFGLGEPRMLVSLPFRGASSEQYDVYMNSKEVATCLQLLGFRGTFLFLDNLPGLNPHLGGAPRWLLWFSLIATHSDMVLFVKEKGVAFTASQLEERAFVPRRVRRCVVELEPGELRWADIYEPDPDAHREWLVGFRDGHTGSKTDFEQFERGVSDPFLRNYISEGIPRDHLFVIDEAGNATTYPLDFPVYGDR